MLLASMPFYSKIIISSLIAFIVIFRTFRLAKDSKGNHSFSMTGIQITSVVVFGVILIDTINDRPPETVHSYVQEVSPTASSVNSIGKKTSTQGKRSRRRRVNTKTTGSSGSSRAIIKEKYYLLGTIFASFCLLYLFGHKNEQMKDWFVKGMMALRRMNPYVHIIDEALVDILENNPESPEIQEFFIRSMLAKQGKTTDPLKKSEEGPGEDDLVTAP